MTKVSAAIRSLILECVLLLQNVFSYHRMCSLSLECILLLQNAFSYTCTHRQTQIDIDRHCIREFVVKARSFVTRPIHCVYPLYPYTGISTALYQTVGDHVQIHRCTEKIVRGRGVYPCSHTQALAPHCIRQLVTLYRHACTQALRHCSMRRACDTAKRLSGS